MGALAAMVAAVSLAGLPGHGVLAPGRALGGLRLGATPAEVRASWGTRYGRCLGCTLPTWYFTYLRFHDQGAGVEFRRGRVAAIFTLWSPFGWHTTDGVAIGDAVARVTRRYGVLQRIPCGTYSALVLRGRNSLTVFYLVDERVWGFGLSDRSLPACR